mmetsp:Transcript_6213/g.9864  ORF Transcript_6213/g.9864 Transcript_6213/m.9864 type:complete len:119 (+) Transcript_6213:1-357(+)
MRLACVVVTLLLPTQNLLGNMWDTINALMIMQMTGWASEMAFWSSTYVLRRGITYGMHIYSEMGSLDHTGQWRMLEEAITHMAILMITTVAVHTANHQLMHNQRRKFLRELYGQDAIL